MAATHGTNLTGVKEMNRALALQLISTGESTSRADLARKMGLTKTTLGNIVSELIAADILQENAGAAKADSEGGALGRRPILLDLSPRSPLIMGMLIKRGLCSVVLSDLKAHIVRQLDYHYDAINTETLIQTLCSLCDQIRDGIPRRIVAIGIASLGPVDTGRQQILCPANFWGMHDIALPAILGKHTGLPAFLIHDSSAGALAEQIYGAPSPSPSFLYLHVMNGIGTGYILDGRLYDGDFGQSGELGHTSINFTGPACSCGNNGCLELYANLRTMNRQIERLGRIYKRSSAPRSTPADYSWDEIIAAGTDGDFLALAAIDEFCEYLMYALRNAIHMLDINHIVVGYTSPVPTTVLEDTLRAKLEAAGSRSLSGHRLHVRSSSFGGEAPLIGSVAVIADKIFKGELSLL